MSKIRHARETMEMNDRQIMLSDGRLLGFSECGLPNGATVFYFHGFPGSRIEARLAQDSATRIGIRLIGIDRPGYGLSTFKENRRLMDWPGDVLELADVLEIDRFAVVGASGGGPYALVCALKISPRRLSAAAVVCGLGPAHDPVLLTGMDPLNRFGLFLGSRFPWISKVFARITAHVLAFHPSWILSTLGRRLGEPDNHTLSTPEVRMTLRNSFREAVRCGYQGLWWDLLLYARPWGYNPGDIQTDLYVWHGLKDKVVPVRMAQTLIGILPNCKSFYLPEEGHLSLIVHCKDEILTALALGY